MQIAIKQLMQDDHNATWDEIETVEELKESLIQACKDHTEYNDNESVEFYVSIYNDLIARQEESKQ